MQAAAQFYDYPYVLLIKINQLLLTEFTDDKFFQISQRKNADNVASIVYFKYIKTKAYGTSNGNSMNRIMNQNFVVEMHTLRTVY